MARMAIMCGEVENDGYGTIYHLSELLKIEASSYEVVFDEDGADADRQVREAQGAGMLPEALLKCVEGDRFRFHGKEGYDFITAYCDSGDAYRDRAFRLQTTPRTWRCLGRGQKIKGNEYLIGA